MAAAPADPRLGAIVSLLDDVESRITDNVGRAADLVDEAERVGNLMRVNPVRPERMEKLLAQTVQLRAASARQRAIVAALLREMRTLRSSST